MKALVPNKVLKKPLSKSQRAKLKVAPFGPAIIIRLSAALSLADRVREFVCLCIERNERRIRQRERARRSETSERLPSYGFFAFVGFGWA
jgi:hypothetical protein